MASVTSIAPQQGVRYPQAVPILAITACDSYEGRVLALKLADHLEKRHGNDPAVPQLLCLARDPSKTGGIKTRSSCKIVQISYDDPNSLTIALRGIQTVILIPEIEPQRVDWSNRTVDIMTQEQVVRCILVSSIGTDAQEKDQLHRFITVEDKVRHSIQRWTILREGFPFQALFYWIPMIQEQGILGMSIRPDVEFAPLDIANLGDALVSVTFPDYMHHPGHDGKGKSDYGSGSDDGEADVDKLISDEISHLALAEDLERFDSQIYTLTGPERVTGPKLADELNRALGKLPEKDKPNDPSEQDKKPPNDPTDPDPVDPTLPPPPKQIVFKTITRDELRAYLLTLRNKDNNRDDVLHRYGGLADMPGIRGAIRLFHQATQAAFRNRRAVHQGSTVVSTPYIPLVEEKEEDWEQADDGDDDQGTTLTGPSLTGIGKDLHKQPGECPCDPEVPHKPDQPDEPEKPGKPGKPDKPHVPERPEDPDKKPPRHRPLLGPPNDTEVDLILDLLDYINEGRATFQSGDLEKIAGIRGSSAKDFFEKYARDFRGQSSSKDDWQNEEDGKKREMVKEKEREL